MTTDNTPQIPDDLREEYEIVCRYQNRNLILCKQLIERIAKAEAALAEARAENAAQGQEFLEYSYSLLTDKPLVDGTWPHLAHCNGDRRVRPGTRGNSCCCQPIWLKENDELRATLARVGAGVTEWTSVEERLPSNESWVLGCRAQGGRRVYWYSESVQNRWSVLLSESGFFDDGELDTQVTHWQPLPEPPARIAPPQPGSKA